MIVVFSDTHLTDGANRTIRHDAFALLRDRVVTRVKRLLEDKERKLASLSVDIVLNGDILDYIRSETWRNKKLNPQGARPWDLPKEFLPILTTIHKGICTQNAKSFKILKGLPAHFKSVGIPETVDVRVHYIIGNHDWFLCLPSSPKIDAIRRSLIKLMGLSELTHQPDQPFPHDPITDCPQLLEIMKQHRVLVRHGDFLDSMNYSGNRMKSSIGDAIVIEMLDALWPTIEKKLKSAKVATKSRDRVRDYIREVDNLRPYSLLPSWLESLVSSIEHSAALGDDAVGVNRAINDSLRELGAAFRRIPFVRDYPGFLRRNKAKLPALISEWLGTRLPHLQEYIMGVVLGHADSDRKYAEGAYREQLLREGKVDSVVYGHTHQHKVVPLDHVTFPDTFEGGRATKEDGNPCRWYYINSGTWRPVHERCQMVDSQNEFSFYHRMTHLTFYTPQERKNHPFDSWTGELASHEFPAEASRDMYVLQGGIRRDGGSAGNGEKQDVPLVSWEKYRIKLYDRDAFKNDPLGEVIPDHFGRFVFGFFEREFQEIGEGDYPEPLLEVFFRGQLIASKKVPWPRYDGRHADVRYISV